MAVTQTQPMRCKLIAASYSGEIMKSIEFSTGLRDLLNENMQFRGATGNLAPVRGKKAHDHTRMAREQSWVLMPPPLHGSFLRFFKGE